jgi:hypothetical protein
MLQVWSEEKAASGLQVGLVCSGQLFAQAKKYKKNPCASIVNSPIIKRL